MKIFRIPQNLTKVIQRSFKESLFCVFPGRQKSIKTIMHDNQYKTQQTQKNYYHQCLSLIKGNLVLHL